MAQSTFSLAAACQVAATSCASASPEAQDHQEEVQEGQLAPVRWMCQKEACLAGTQKSQHQGVGETQGQGSDAQVGYGNRKTKHMWVKSFRKLLVLSRGWKGS